MTNSEYKRAMIETMEEEHKCFRALVHLCCLDHQFLAKFDAWSIMRIGIAKDGKHDG